MKDRLKALNSFRAGLLQILISTDVLSCGIDVPNADFVVHYQLPTSFTTFIHRSGRASRKIGKKGESILLVGDKDIRALKIIQNHVKVEKIKYKDEEMLKGMKQLISLEKNAEFRLEDSGFEERRKELRKRKVQEI
eukprot:GHVP01066652.1.p1 GENE.GHVP01066652.1~~GHVP01066652.1.p1  ORF type:complete len:157 (-),score=31.74 GHVP01066652.1:461-868(-)